MSENKFDIIAPRIEFLWGNNVHTRYNSYVINI